LLFLVGSLRGASNLVSAWPEECIWQGVDRMALCICRGPNLFRNGRKFSRSDIAKLLDTSSLILGILSLPALPTGIFENFQVLN
jgi:hypothetical protein